MSAPEPASWHAVVDAVRHRESDTATPAHRRLLRSVRLVPYKAASNHVYRVHSGGGAYYLKLYRRDAPRSRAEREWDALSLLAEHQHSCAPRPVYRDLDHPLPAVVMDRVAGRSFVRQVLTRPMLMALAVALRENYHITPEMTDERYVGLFPTWQAPEPLLPEWLDELDPADLDPLQREARTMAEAWLRGPDPDVLRRQMPRVFACMDCNGSNWLWNGERIAIVDYEEGVWRDRASDLAEIIEWNHAWSILKDFDRATDAKWSWFIDQFDLSPTEEERFRAAQRWYAWVWTLRCWPDLAKPDTRSRPRYVPRQERFEVHLERVRRLGRY